MKLKSLQMFRVPSLMLAAALQVMPMVRAALPAFQTAGNVLAIIFRWSAGAAAALGGVNAVSGASTTITNPLNVKGTNGMPFLLRLTTAPDQAHFWQASGLPNGLSLVGIIGQTSWKIQGTPAATGVFNVNLTAKDQANSSASRTVTATLVLNIVAGVSRPVITAQPASLVRTQGESATFSVTASGTGTLAYQWRFKNASLPGQAASSLTINPVTTQDAGNYDVIVSNSGGSVTSSVASLTVIVPVAPPSISVQPTNMTVTAGQPAGFSIAATGTAPLNYQWRFAGNNLAGQTNSALNFPVTSTNNAGSYDIIVSNNGGSVTSSVAVLTVVQPVIPPAITVQPVNQSVTVGQPAAFSVTATGTAPLSYQWRFNGGNLIGQTNSNLIFGSAAVNNGGNYDVIVRNGGGSVTSAVVSLTVTVPITLPYITAQPTNITVLAGNPAAFSVAAGGAGPLEYKWRFGGNVLAARTNATLTFAAVTTNDAGEYDVIVSNSAGSVTSLVATLIVTLPAVKPMITTQPTPQTVTAGQTATFDVAANGTGPLTFFWRKGVTVVSVSGDSTFSIVNAQASDSGNYSVIVSNSAGFVTSQAASLAVTAPPPQLAMLTVQISGPGSVTPNYNGQQLAIGSNYTMTAVPGSGAAFVNWTGGVSASTATVSFTMQSNLVLTANFQMIPAGVQFTNGTYSGLFFEAGGITLSSSGPFSAVTTARGTYTAKLTLNGKTHPISGRFAADGRATNSVSRGARPALKVELAVMDGNPDQILGRVTDGTWVADLIADRAVFSATNPAPQRGSYTFVLPGTPGSVEIPAGSGFGTVSIDAAGRVKMKGTLADGSKVSQSSTISKAGEWPLYASLYRGIGSLLGWVTFSEQSSSDMQGEVNWLKRQQPSNVYYPMGFNFNINIAGSKYTAPASGQRALNLTSGILSFTGGNLSAAITNSVVLQPNNSVTTLPGSLPKVTLNSSAGLFKGTFVHPSTRKPVRFQGALLQKQNHGAGFFMGSSQSGDVYFGE